MKNRNNKLLNKIKLAHEQNDSLLLEKNENKNQINGKKINDKMVRYAKKIRKLTKIIYDRNEMLIIERFKYDPNQIEHKRNEMKKQTVH